MVKTKNRLFECPLLNVTNSRDWKAKRNKGGELWFHYLETFVFEMDLARYKNITASKKDTILPRLYFNADEAAVKRTHTDHNMITDEGFKSESYQGYLNFFGYENRNEVFEKKLHNILIKLKAKLDCA